MMRSLVLVLVLVGATLAAPLPAVDETEALWKLFKLSFKKEYESEALENLRRNVFLDNKRAIDEHNARYEEGKVSFKMGLNQFSDMTLKEFSDTNNGFRMPGKSSLPVWSEAAATVKDLPDYVDWRRNNMVTPVKNQGQCGSCWAFSSTGALEGQHSIQAGELVSLSESQLVDCAADYGPKGCNGGWMDDAYKYIVANGGIDTEASYPYVPQQRTCAFNSATIGANMTGSVRLPSGDEDALKKAVATIGPIAVAIDATSATFMSYQSGVYYDTTCSSVKLDHAVLVVGYGTDSSRNLDYWIVKNSWDVTWGEKGYILMARGYSNMCGIATHAVYPTVAW